MIKFIIDFIMSFFKKDELKETQKKLVKDMTEKERIEFAEALDRQTKEIEESMK